MTLEPNPEIEATIIYAKDGDSEALKRFYSALLAGPLYVPKRTQTHKMSDAPNYPNDFVYILGIQDKDRVVVPAFTNPKHIFTWCGLELAYLTFSGTKLLELIPQDWTLVLNLGQEIVKELTWWEISNLAKGGEGIDEVIADQQDQQPPPSLQVLDVEPNELQELKNGLAALGKDSPEIKAVYLLKELMFNIDSEVVSKNEFRILVGLDLSTPSDKVLAEAESVAKLHSIGSYDTSIVPSIVKNQENAFFKIFLGSIPIYMKKKKFFSWLNWG